MSDKKRGRPPAKKAAPVELDPEDEREPEDDEPEGEGYDLPWEEDLRQWENENRAEKEVARFVLYRRLDKQGGPKEQVWEWEDEFPRRHQIGCLFGGGKFSIYGILPRIRGQKKDRIRVRHFMLADSYNAERDRRLREAMTLTGTTPGNPSVTVHDRKTDLEIMAFTIQNIVEPLLKAGRAVGGAPAAAAVDMRGLNTMVMGIVEESARAQIATAERSAKAIAQAHADTKPEKEKEVETEDEDVFDWKELLKEFLKEHGKELIELTGLKQRLAAASMKKDPVVREVFQTLSGNENLFHRALGMLMQDPEVDKTLAEKAIGKLADMGFGLRLQAQPRPPAAVAAPRPSTPPAAPAAPRPPAAVNGTAQEAVARAQ